MCQIIGVVRIKTATKRFDENKVTYKLSDIFLVADRVASLPTVRRNVDIREVVSGISGVKSIFLNFLKNINL